MVKVAVRMDRDPFYQVVGYMVCDGMSNRQATAIAIIGAVILLLIPATYSNACQAVVDYVREKGGEIPILDFILHPPSPLPDINLLAEIEKNCKEGIIGWIYYFLALVLLVVTINRLNARFQPKY